MFCNMHTFGGSSVEWLTHCERGGIEEKIGEILACEESQANFIHAICFPFLGKSLVIKKLGCISLLSNDLAMKVL